MSVKRLVGPLGDSISQTNEGVPCRSGEVRVSSAEGF